MKNARSYLLFALLILASGCELRPPSPAPQTTSVESVPAVAPSTPQVEPLEASYLSGGTGTFSLAAFKGRVVVLDVCATWSPASQAQASHLNLLQEEHRTAGLSVVGLVVDGAPTSTLESLHAAYPLVGMPRTMLSQLGKVRSVPALLVVDRLGKVRNSISGYATPEQLLAEIAPLLKE
jgi:thiol-disulfide isomerase/thioredoxin